MNILFKLSYLFCLILAFFFTKPLWALTTPAQHGYTQNQDQLLPSDIMAIKKKGVLTVAFYHYDIPPFFMHDNKGNWVGIEVDLAQKIADLLGVKLVIVPAPSFDAITIMVAEHKADMGMGLVGITPERALYVSFTNPYYRFHPHLLVNRVLAAKEGWNPWNVLAKMETSEKPLKIGVLKASGNIEVVQENFPNAEIVPYDNIIDAMHDVIRQKLFAAVGNSPLQVRAFLKAHPGAVIQLSDVEIPSHTDLIAIALPWNSYHLREWLNNYLNYLLANNVQIQLLAKYGQS